MWPDKHDTAIDLRADMGVKGGFGAIFIRHPRRFHTEAAQIFLNEINKFKIAIAADRGKANQAVHQFSGGQGHVYPFKIRRKHA